MLKQDSRTDKANVLGGEPKVIPKGNFSLQVNTPSASGGSA